MTLADYDHFCGALPHATHVVQWGGSHVWKVGGKVFAIASQENGETPGVTFKCSRLSFELLAARPGLRPAPYLASRGLPWVQWTGPDSMDWATLKDYLRESHRLVSLGLARKLRVQLGFEAG